MFYAWSFFVRENMYKYREFGFNIESDIELPSTPTANFEDEADISIIKGDFSEELLRSLDKIKEEDGLLYSIEEGKIIALHKQYGVFICSEGSKLEYYLIPGCSIERFLIFINCYGLGYLMIQRKEIAIHGSAATWNGKGIIVTGVSGAGKSSITEELLRRGCGFLSDDLVRITNEDGINKICPANPCRKLCRDTAEKYGYDVNLMTHVIDEERDKYYINEDENYVNDNTKAYVCINLLVGDVEKPEIEEIQGGEKVKLILNNLFRADVYHYYGNEPMLFLAISKLASNIKMYKITRPAMGYTIAERADMILQIVDETV